MAKYAAQVWIPCAHGIVGKVKLGHSNLVEGVSNDVDDLIIREIEGRDLHPRK